MTTPKMRESNQLLSQMQTMLARSESYKAEAEAEKNFADGEIHARVCSVLRELVRLGKAFEAQNQAADTERLDWIISYVRTNGLVGLHEAISEVYRRTELREFNRESIDCARAALGEGES